MQCGVCRIPFKSEYFGDDAVLIQIYENKMNFQFDPFKRRFVNKSEKNLGGDNSNCNIS